MFWYIEIGNVVSFILPLKRLKKGLFMATVKFDEGKKFETSMDLEEGEGLLFVRPPKNLILQRDKKNCQINLVITNKRVVTIPYPKFAKKYPAISYYFNDIKSVNSYDASEASQQASYAAFEIITKSGKNSGAEIWVTYEFNLLNLLKIFSVYNAEQDAKNPWATSGLAVFNATAATVASKAEAERTGASHYTEYSPNYAKMAEAAKARASGMDFKKAGHTQIRDYIVDLIDKCIEEENK